MLQYEKIDVAEGIDINKTSPSKEYMLGFKFIYVRFKFETHFVINVIMF